MALLTDQKPPVTLSRSGHFSLSSKTGKQWPLRLSVTGGFHSVDRAVHL